MLNELIYILRKKDAARYLSFVAQYRLPVGFPLADLESFLAWAFANSLSGLLCFIALRPLNRWMDSEWHSASCLCNYTCSFGSICVIPPPDSNSWFQLFTACRKYPPPSFPHYIFNFCLLLVKPEHKTSSGSIFSLKPPFWKRKQYWNNCLIKWLGVQNGDYDPKTVSKRRNGGVCVWVSEGWAGEGARGGFASYHWQHMPPRSLSTYSIMPASWIRASEWRIFAPGLETTLQHLQ